MGRPKKSIRKEKKITVSCTRMDFILLKNAAQKTSLSLSEFLLNSGLGHPIEAKFSNEEVVLFRKLANMSNSLNQIARRLNNGETLKIRCLNDLEKVTQILKEFK
ncbi:plasmid mobilization protein [Reichenbachiella sp.]|uniref:plasmid mobilization protein n=1 Tax=Reichenbachiella sp. TaxID=2184521 RepID=UPI003BAFDF96